MDVQWILIIHALLTLLVVISFLCGQWPIFQGTPIQRIHYFLTFGAYDYFLRFVGVVFGEKGTNAILSWSIAAAIALILSYRYTSLLGVSIGVLFFLLTSFSDPGTVTAENVSQYQSAYPYDNIIFTEKECSTCKIPKPARSKHCSICDRCVARFDHHCGWMNNCIGEKNARYFMAFLLWHFLLCLYGTIVIGLVLAGRMKELRVVHILTVYYGIENSFRSLTPHVVQWLLGSYNTQILLMVFLAIISLLLAGFFGYNANLCRINTTTNEAIKWQDYMNWQRKVNEARTSAAALTASISGMSSDSKPLESKWKTFFRRSPLEASDAVVKNNIYDKGIFHNVWEIIFPLSTRHSFSQTKKKSG